MDEQLNNNGVVLSREELLYLLYLLKTNYVLGLDPDPIGELDKEQIKLGLIFSERSLRARGLAAIDDKGDLQVDSSLLAMVETCAFWDLSVALHCFQPEGLRRKLFFHRRMGLTVKHSLPGPQLHRFSFLVDDKQLVNEILKSCDIFSPHDKNFPEIRMESSLLGKVKEMAIKDRTKAAELLIDTGSPAIAAHEISSILSDVYSMSVLHWVYQDKGSEPVKKEMTILSGKTSTWVMKNDGDGKAILSPAGNPEIKKIIKAII